LPALEAGARFEITLHVAIAAGYHIQPAEAEDAVRTNVRVRSVGAAIIASQDWHYPVPQSVDGAMGYADTIDIRGVCTLKTDAPPGKHVLRVTLTTQACTATACLAPQQVTVEMPVTVKEHTQ
jgi:DsbC/DsbD-like thiol-disulfide interchange protein